MERRIVDGEITLVPYYPNYKASLPCNAQSQRMFERTGFHKAGDELYEMEL